MKSCPEDLSSSSWNLQQTITERKTWSTFPSWHAVTRASLGLHSKQAWMHSDCASCAVTAHLEWNPIVTWVSCTSNGSSWESFPHSEFHNQIIACLVGGYWWSFYWELQQQFFFWECKWDEEEIKLEGDWNLGKELSFGFFWIWILFVFCSLSVSEEGESGPSGWGDQTCQRMPN